jgi:hypothetical protein
MRILFCVKIDGVEGGRPDGEAQYYGQQGALYRER